VKERVERLPLDGDARHAEAFELGEELTPDHLDALEQSVP